MTAMGFADWVRDARQSAAASNMPMPPWLATDEAAKRIFDQMIAADAPRQAKAEERTLRAEVAGLKQRVRELERMVGSTTNAGILIKATADAMAENHREIAADIKAAREQITKETDQKIAEIERSRIKYHGVFEHGVVYREGSMVTKAGSLWIARGETNQTPGEGNTSWTLAVKSGATTNIPAIYPTRQAAYLTGAGVK
jgi:hypothetical protein